MALRIALGASPLSVIKLISLDGLRPVLEGIVIGVLAAMAGRQIIQTALAEPWPAIGVADCIIVAFALLVVSLAVCVTIGRRASMTNPSDLLRSL